MATALARFSEIFVFWQHSRNNMCPYRSARDRQRDDAFHIGSRLGDSEKHLQNRKVPFGETASEERILCETHRIKRNWE